MKKSDARPKRIPHDGILVRTSLAFGLGVVLGFFGSILLGHWQGAGELFLIWTPLLFGIIGMFAGGAHTKHPKLRGFVLSGCSWLGTWLAVLVWTSFQPQMINTCGFHDDYPCPPIMVSFWGAYTSSFLFMYLVFFFGGLVLVGTGHFISAYAIAHGQ